MSPCKGLMPKEEEGRLEARTADLPNVGFGHGETNTAMHHLTAGNSKKYGKGTT